MSLKPLGIHKDSMYLHIVLMAPHTPVSPELAPKLDQAFIRIHQECSGIERFEWVPNLSRSSARYSHALLSVFRTQEALDAYRQSDAHQAMLDAIAAHRPAVTFLAYPNNPTATLWDEGAVQRIIDAAGAQGGIVVMDEAYQPFASRSWITRMKADPARNAHVLLMRTLSKFGLAGARLGYLIGPSALVNEIDKVRPPYNISVLNCETAIFALQHESLYAEQAAAIRAERQPLIDALAALPGVATVWPSEANMVLLRVRDAAHAQAQMKARGVLVKNVSAMHPLLANCLRLTVGTAQENAQMLAALKESL